MERDLVRKPWGFFEVLASGANWKIKRLVIFPNSRISLQSHKYRDELWIVIKGTCKAIKGNSKVILKEKDYIFIPRNVKHRAENIGDVNLEIIEVQMGEYLEDDDITRYEDDYGRV